MTKRERTKHQILGAAGRLFREDGYKPTRIDQVMQSVGLTVGGFYNHFESKESLLSEVVSATVSGVVEGQQNDSDKPIRSLDEILDLYLSQVHRDNPAEGCLLPCLSGEIARADDQVRHAYTEFVQRMFDKLSKVVSAGGGLSKRERAISIVSTLVGGLMVARAVNDESVSLQILAATRKAAKQI